MTFGVIGSVLGVVAGLVAVATLGGYLWARFKTSADETTAALWQGEAAAQKARADRLEDEFTKYRDHTTSQLAALTSRIDSLESENRVLKSLEDIRDSVREDIRAAFATLPCQLLERKP